MKSFLNPEIRKYCARVNKNTTMITLKPAFELFASCLLYSSIIALIDFIIILFIRQEPDGIVFSLSLALLAEGGVGLTIGGVTALFSPTASKVEEVLFNSKPWNAKRQKDAEKQARRWIGTGSILVLFGLLISAI